MSYLILILLSVVVAFAKAAANARALKVNHAIEWLGVSLVLGGASIVNAHTLAGYAYHLGICFGAFAIPFRLMYNRFKGKAWWYMGPEKRGTGESVYDTLFWWICATSINQTVFTQGVWKKVYNVNDQKMPAKVAYLFELTVYIAGTCGHFILTNN